MKATSAQDHNRLKDESSPPTITSECSSIIEALISHVDSSFYRLQSPDLSTIEDAAEHYVLVGASLGLNPSSDFDTSFYVRANPDVAEAGINPLYHYITFGRAEDRATSHRAHQKQIISNDFDSVFYLSQLKSGSDISDPILHYIDQGAKLGLDPSKTFSTCFYLSEYVDVLEIDLNPFVHYVTTGREEGRLPHSNSLAPSASNEVVDTIGANIDVEYYLDQLSVLPGNPFEAARHYIAIGCRLGLDPAPNFSTTYYQNVSADLQTSTINPYLHYLKWGRLEGRRAHPTLARSSSASSFDVELLREHFDSDYYIANLTEPLSGDADPVLHYLHFGYRLGLDPSPNFSTRFYISRYPDIAGDTNPFLHYLKSGKKRGRLPKIPATPSVLLSGELEVSADVKKLIEPHFDAKFYRDRYRDIRSAGLDPLEHYLIAGWKEGRDPSPWFDTKYYMRAYPDVELTRINPLLHYVIWGASQGFLTFEPTGALSSIGSPDSKAVHDLALRSLLLAREHSPSPAGRSDTPINPHRLNIHWVIPDFNAGGGGHMTIFRMVNWLEIFGHRCTIWIYNPVMGRTDREREELMINSYQTVAARIHSLGESSTFENVDAIVATSWDTAHFVSYVEGPKQRFYFVQDYEPYFYPVGATYLAARSTYHLGLSCICASKWLERTMVEKHQAWARSFPLCADESYREPASRPDNQIPRIAFYAREHTTRRAVELGLLAFEILAKEGFKFHVDLFGSSHTIGSLPFLSSQWGICDASTLASIYGSADLGVCFSATNYSLVPQEMIACGLPVLELDTESAREAFPPDVVAFGGPDPADIARKIKELLLEKSALQALRVKGREWVSQLSWESSARCVEAAMLEKLTGTSDVAAPALIPSAPRATVVIPTYNGGALLKRVIEQLSVQRTAWDYEIVIIDSSSSDGTAQYLQTLGDVARVKTISKSEFGHGRTRNVGADMARGEYVLFLTQDALPSGTAWLHSFINIMDKFPHAAGAFGRHLAWPDASPYVRRDLKSHFDGFDAAPMCVSRYSDPTKYRKRDRGWRSFLHFFSDNNSCLRKSVWKRVPYPDVDYGEDQIWASKIIDLGYSKVYARTALVYHSHEYNELETFERARTEANFFRKHFSYNLTPHDLTNDVLSMNIEDDIWGVRHGVPRDIIDRQKRLNAHRLSGLAAGAIGDVDYASAF